MTSQPQRVIRFLKGAMMHYMPGMITCAEFDDFIVGYLDGTLPEKVRRLFEFHIRYCRECREYLLAYRRTVELEKAAFRASEAQLPEDVPEDLIQAILKSREARP
jgi:anti-sigma factor RsiW